MPNEVDILEDDILNSLGENIFNALLKDHTRSMGLHDGQQCNIIWATHDYEQLGPGYAYHEEIKIPLITGDNGKVVMPRTKKVQEAQDARVKERAEVFTPSWVCNAQNNLVDEAWFGRCDVFNHENADHTWTATTDKIDFPENKTWRDYVRDTRLEITCGEAPYLVSRYDATTGQPIELYNRIGLLDRKLRVVSENCSDERSWVNAAKIAFMSTYGYEWQGDNLLLAREALLYTFIDYYKAMFDKLPSGRYMQSIAYIISWNIWQMDGLKGVVPDSCHDETSTNLFGETTSKLCKGCANDNIRLHNGSYCHIRDWAKTFSRPGIGKTLRFIDLLPITK